tara:strand:- start:6431 stop:7423 length:993 start_codon:yes stop_codon:yes gene_type:complete
MAKLTRKLQKLFGSGAGGTGITEFGSPATGTPVYTTDLDAIQTTAYENGWADAALAGGEIPAFQDFNALQFANAYQIKYIQQEGICEFLSTQEYHTNSVVKKSGTYELYGSIINDNIGNALPSQADDANWAYLGLLGGAPDASETVKGIVELATDAEVIAGVDTTKAVTPAGLNGVKSIKLQASVATTSGSAVDFIGIPSGVNRVTLHLDKVSLNTGANPIIQIGSGVTPQVTGYDGSGTYAGGNSTLAATPTNGFEINSLVASRAISGSLVLNRKEDDTWVCSGVFGTLFGFTYQTAGSITLSGELGVLRLGVTAGALNNGSASISWEF